MKCLALIAVCLMAVSAACGQQTAPTPAAVQMSLRDESEPPAAGETTLIVALRDASGAPIDGAALQVHASMDHEGMMPVERESSTSANGEYRVPFNWSMGGGWIVTVTARLPNNGGEASETFEMFVEAMSSESIIQHN